MSLNDLFEMDLTPVLAVIAIVFIIVFPYCLIKGNQIKRDIESQPISVKENAKVISKRIGTIPGTGLITNFVTFQFTDGCQKEFGMKDQQTYMRLMEGQIGTLCHRGDQYIDFRENKN